MSSSLTPAQPARGRPSAFNPDRAEKLINAIRGGAYQKQAAEHAGISYNTLRRWLIKAQSEEATPELIEFAAAIEKANADAEVAAVAKIRSIGNEGNWQALAWWLERRHPERWAKSDTARVEIVGMGEGHRGQIAGVDLTSAGIAALARRLATQAEEDEQDIVDAEVLDELEASLEEEEPVFPDESVRKSIDEFLEGDEDFDDE
jgi:hypothetical protein